MFAFAGGASSSAISDGGQDMYDYGNRLEVMAGSDWSSGYLSYTQVCDGSTAASAGVGDVVYATCKTAGAAPVFAAAFASPSESIRGFRTSGNLGADGGGRM